MEVLADRFRNMSDDHTLQLDWYYALLFTFSSLFVVYILVYCRLEDQTGSDVYMAQSLCDDDAVVVSSSTSSDVVSSCVASSEVASSPSEAVEVVVVSSPPTAVIVAESLPSKEAVVLSNLAEMTSLRTPSSVNRPKYASTVSFASSVLFRGERVKVVEVFGGVGGRGRACTGARTVRGPAGLTHDHFLVVGAGGLHERRESLVEGVSGAIDVDLLPEGEVVGRHVVDGLDQFRVRRVGVTDVCDDWRWPPRPSRHHGTQPRCPRGCPQCARSERHRSPVASGTQPSRLQSWTWTSPPTCPARS
ncbi:hypothetical protein GQ600_14035 [Phytophthora cactorum]|nr:hypothetical protein GQ600_14035 [Phytophthora cactorum]